MEVYGALHGRGTGLLGGHYSSRLGPARLSADLLPEEVCMAATALLQAPAPTCSCCNGAALSSVHITLALWGLCRAALALLHNNIGMSAELEWNGQVSQA